MGLLTQNGKMKKLSKDAMTVVNWTIPAFQSSTGIRTCPNAGACAAGCYARMGAYIWGNVSKKHEANLELSQSDAFVSEMIAEIDAWLLRKSTKHLKVRIHDAGDFYSVSYLGKWVAIMSHFKTNSRVSFYAYTKQVKMFQAEKARIPSNFTVIFSHGGKQDALIDVKIDRHARVFETLQDLKEQGYVDGTLDDMIAAQGTSSKIGLVYHGTKSYKNTAWNRVSQSESSG